MRLFFILALITTFAKAQCVGTQTHTINPPPPAGGYTPGTAVTVCYTMNGWPGLNVGSNWLEGFDINLGSGWTNLQQMAAPANCGGGSGQWVWILNNITPNGVVGPGWFFDSGINGPLNGIPSDDWGDQGTTCVWSFCFQVTVANSCTPQSLLIQVTAGGDGTWGNWINNACPTTPYTIYSGMSNILLPTLPNISHN